MLLPDELRLDRGLHHSPAIISIVVAQEKEISAILLPANNAKEDSLVKRPAIIMLFPLSQVVSPIWGAGLF
jgi:predicted ATPase with chaperone activity